MEQNKRLSYWGEVKKISAIIIGCWCLVVALSVTPLSHYLDGVSLFGFPLGFWFANQAGEIMFLLMVVAYARLMFKLDKKFGILED